MTFRPDAVMVVYGRFIKSQHARTQLTFRPDAVHTVRRLDEEDYAYLAQHMDVVVHAAAQVDI